MTPVCWKPPQFVMRHSRELQIIFNTTFMHENLYMRNLYFIFTMVLRVQNELVTTKLHICSHQKDYFGPN